MKIIQILENAVQNELIQFFALCSAGVFLLILVAKCMSLFESIQKAIMGHD